MPEPMTPETFLDACTVDEAVFELRPDYRALLLVVDGLTPPASGEGNNMVDTLIAQAEAHARNLLADSPVNELAHIASWREAFRGFGAKRPTPRTRPPTPPLPSKPSPAAPRKVYRG